MGLAAPPLTRYRSAAGGRFRPLAGESPVRAAFALMIVASATVAFAGEPAWTAPPASGADLFNDQCGSCHTLDARSGPLAPSLKGVAGRKIASLGDFAYSDALKGKGGDWTDTNLDAFIGDPQTFAPGTEMLAGAPDPAARKAIIDYLKSVQ
jgi:cytochrome c2